MSFSAEIKDFLGAFTAIRKQNIDADKNASLDAYRQSQQKIAADRLGETKRHHGVMAGISASRAKTSAGRLAEYQRHNRAIEAGKGGQSKPLIGLDGQPLPGTGFSGPSAAYNSVPPPEDDDDPALEPTVFDARGGMISQPMQPGRYQRGYALGRPMEMTRQDMPQQAIPMPAPMPMPSMERAMPMPMPQAPGGGIGYAGGTPGFNERVAQPMMRPYNSGGMVEAPEHYAKGGMVDEDFPPDTEEKEALPVKTEGQGKSNNNENFNLAETVTSWFGGANVGTPADQAALAERMNPIKLGLDAMQRDMQTEQAPAPQAAPAPQQAIPTAPAPSMPPAAPQGIPQGMAAQAMPTPQPGRAVAPDGSVEKPKSMQSMSDQEYLAVLKKVDPENRLTKSAGYMAVLQNTVNHYMERGDRKTAEAFAAGLLNYGKMNMMKFGALADLAIQNRDWRRAGQYIAMAGDYIPDGKKYVTTTSDKGMRVVEVDEATGAKKDMGTFAPEEAQEFAQALSSGQAWLGGITNLATGNRSLLKQQDLSNARIKAREGEARTIAKEGRDEARTIATEERGVARKYASEDFEERNKGELAHLQSLYTRSAVDTKSGNPQTIKGTSLQDKLAAHIKGMNPKAKVEDEIKRVQTEQLRVIDEMKPRWRGDPRVLVEFINDLTFQQDHKGRIQTIKNQSGQVVGFTWKGQPMPLSAQGRAAIMALRGQFPDEGAAEGAAEAERARAGGMQQAEAVPPEANEPYRTLRPLRRGQ